MSTGWCRTPPSPYNAVADRDFAFREDYFAASGRLADYVCELELSGDDLSKLMRSGRVAPTVKRAIADHVDYVRERLSPSAAAAICEWAVFGNTVAGEMIAALAQAGAGAEHVLPVLEPELQSIELVLLEQILVSLGDEYEPLTRPGRHRPKLKDRDGTSALLEELRRRGHVSSYSAGLFGGIKVNMRIG